VKPGSPARVVQISTALNGTRHAILKSVSGHDIVVIGASSGGVEALSRVVRRLPVSLEASVFLVLHMSPSRSSALPAILAREAALPTSQAIDGEPIRRGHIYVAAPDRHLVVRPGHMALTAGPTENRVRPSIDALFRSAAVAYPGRTIGVVLTGNLDDGAAGLAAIKRCGGIAVVQDPSEAFAQSMPRAALDATEVDHIAYLDEMGPLIERLVAAPSRTHEAPRDLVAEVASSFFIEQPLGQAVIRGPDTDMPAPLACPECGGGLMPVSGTDLSRVARYRCHVGHTFSARTLLAALGDDVERALWVALRSLEERIALLDVLAREQEERDRHLTGRQYRSRADELRSSVKSIRELLMAGVKGVDEPLHEASD
jgi:two-component system, chemotaxis family, protein-glutamate methylesterase/glutaminase